MTSLPSGRPSVDAALAMPTRVPFAPVQARLDAAGGLYLFLTAHGHAYGTTSRERWEKALERGAHRGGLTLYTADTLAAHLLGVHPVDVWGETWWTATTAETDRLEALAAHRSAARAADAARARPLDEVA